MKSHTPWEEISRARIAYPKQTGPLVLRLVLLFSAALLFFWAARQTPLGKSIVRWEAFPRCDVFNGEWVPYAGPPYYTSRCSLVIDQQNCVKFGRPDTGFTRWRWRPYECELPRFDATEFLKIVRGKSMAFVGDSLGRNQMHSLLCLLSSVSYPKDISATRNYNFKTWFYSDYDFRLSFFWSPYLVRSGDADPDGHSYNSVMTLDLDKPDDAWATKIKTFNYVIFTGGQWFFRPLIYYEKGRVVGCHACGRENVTKRDHYFGYRMAFRTALKTLLRLEGYQGSTFLTTYSPSHFENGEWNTGGNCQRTRPFMRKELRIEWYNMEMYLTQVEEVKAANKAAAARKRSGLRFQAIKVTEAMLMRPDGHPGQYGRSPDRNASVNDCVHWCTPGPVDTWNEFLLHLIKT